MKYKIGQKVVFIGPDFRRHALIVAVGGNVPVPGSIYTIRGGRLMPAALIATVGAEVGYLLEEIVNTARECFICHEVMEMHIPEEMLRPLQERKNDGEAFVAALLGAPVKEDA